MTAHAAASPVNVQALREDFPALRQEVHGKPLAYLDNAASAQTPTIFSPTPATARTRSRGCARTTPYRRPGSTRRTC